MKLNKEVAATINAYVVRTVSTNPKIKLRDLMGLVKYNYKSTLEGCDEPYLYHLVHRYLKMAKLNIAQVEISKEVVKEGYPPLQAYTTPIGSNDTSFFTDHNTWAPRPEVVGIIGDTHEPFCYPGYREFCQETFKKYGVTRVVHIGDEVDNHAISYHEKHNDAMGMKDEADKAQEALKLWYAMFPNVTCLVGNHGALPHRKAQTAGIPKRFIKAYEDAWQAPAGWKWEMEVVIDGVLYTHGIGCTSSPSGAIDKALRSRQSVVIGHIHSFGGVQYHASNNDLVFGLNAGCGVDNKAYAFEYGKNFNNKPTLGCGIVIEGHQAIFVPMNLGSKYVLS